MQKVLTAEEMREVDQLTTEKYGIPSILLMENAAHAAARVITEKLGGSVKDKRFNVLCGTGNNGGDGAALARVLWTLGARVTLLLFGKVHETKGDAKINFEIFKKLASIDYSSEFIECKKNSFQETFHRVFFDKTWGNYDAVVDAMFGTGLNKPLNEDFAYIADVLCNKQKWKQRKNENLIVSLDIPSGLNADSAEQIGENIHADVTVTFTAPKIANVMSPASSFNGELYIANIGSQSLLGKVKTQTFVVIPDGIRGLLCKTQVQTNSYKKTRGTALIIAGSKNYSGAAVLAANASFATGAGMVTVAVPDSIKMIVASKTSDEIIVRTLEETDVSSEKVDVVAVGCGLSNDAETRKFIRETVENRQTPMVLDAEALNALSPFDLKGSDKLPLILTPHIGEMKRLLGSDEEITDRVKTAREFSQKQNVILVLKGEKSLIAAPDGNVYINPTGNAGVSRAGAGDTLTGIITGFLAQTFAIKEKYDAEDKESNMEKALMAVISALYAAGLAGDIAAVKFGQRFMTATNIKDCLVEAVVKIDGRENISLGVTQLNVRPTIYEAI